MQEAFKQEDAAPLLSHSDRVQPLVECYKRRCSCPSAVCACALSIIAQTPLEQGIQRTKCSSNMTCLCYVLAFVAALSIVSKSGSNTPLKYQSNSLYMKRAKLIIGCIQYHTQKQSFYFEHRCRPQTETGAMQICNRDRCFSILASKQSSLQPFPTHTAQMQHCFNGAARAADCRSVHVSGVHCDCILAVCEIDE